MSLKTNTFTMARSAIFNHTMPLSARWGEMDQEDDGTVRFSAMPAVLETLRVEPEFNKRWMGGTCAMNFKFLLPLTCCDSAKLVFKGSRGGQFTGTTNGQFSTSLLNALNANKKLKETLLSIDLDKLEIIVENETVETVFTPYGGGLAYLLIPPVRSLIPLPAEQVSDIAWSLEKIASVIECTHQHHSELNL